MLTVTISQAKNRLSALIDMVRHGETVLVLDRTVPVVRIEPANPGPTDDSAETMSQLERRGLLRRGKGALPPGFFTGALPRLAKGASAVRALVKEREEGR